MYDDVTLCMMMWHSVLELTSKLKLRYFYNTINIIQLQHHSCDTMYDDVTLHMMMWHYAWWCDQHQSIATSFNSIHFFNIFGDSIHLFNICGVGAYFAYAAVGCGWGGIWSVLKRRLVASVLLPCSAAAVYYVLERKRQIWEREREEREREGERERERLCGCGRHRCMYLTCTICAAPTLTNARARTQNEWVS